MGVLLNIQLALDTKLNTLSPAVATAWPNTHYKPTENTSWMRPTLMPARSQEATLAGAIYHQGIYQVDIFVPLEKGVAALMAIEDNIYTLFKSAVLTKNTSTIRIDVISRGPTSREEAWYRGIIEIEFSCFDA